MHAYVHGCSRATNAELAGHRWACMQVHIVACKNTKALGIPAGVHAAIGYCYSSCKLQHCVMQAAGRHAGREVSIFMVFSTALHFTSVQDRTLPFLTHTSLPACTQEAAGREGIRSKMVYPSDY